MKSYQCVPCAVLFAYKWHNIITLSGLYLEGVNISLSASSCCRDTRKRDANWREESIFMWRLTFNYVWGIRLGVAPEMFENNILRSGNSEGSRGRNLNSCLRPALNGTALNGITMLWPASNWMSRVKCWQRRRAEADRNKKEIDTEAGWQRQKITQNENKQENNVMNRHIEGRNERRGVTTMEAKEDKCSFPEESNLPKLQLSFITAHLHVL